MLRLRCERIRAVLLVQRAPDARLLRLLPHLQWRPARKLLAYAALATSVCGLERLLYAALSYLLPHPAWQSALRLLV